MTTAAVVAIIVLLFAACFFAYCLWKVEAEHERTINALSATKAQLQAQIETTEHLRDELISRRRQAMLSDVLKGGN